MHRICAVLLASLLTALAWTSAGGGPENHPPVAPVRPVTDVYFGTKVVDPYRWMEDRTSPEFIRYVLAQGAYAARVLGKIPGRDRLVARVAAHTGGGTLVRFVQRAGGRIFFLQRGPTDDTYKLYVRDSAVGPDRLLVDPDRYMGQGHVSIDYHQPSQIGDKIAFGISSGGSEHSVIHVMDVATGKELPETIDRAENGGISWLPDGKGFFYNRMVATRPGDPETARYLNSKAYLHVLGEDPGKDVALIGTNVGGSPRVGPPDVPSIYTQSGSDQALAIISHGSAPALEILVAPLAEAERPGAHWRKIADTPDGVTSVAIGGNVVYLLLHKDAPRYKVVALDLATLDWTRARTIVPESTRVIEDIQPAADGLYIRDLDAGIGRLRLFDYATGALRDLTMPVQGTLDGPATDPLQPGVMFGLQSWLMPSQWFVAEGGRISPLMLAPKWSEDLSGFVAEETKVRAMVQWSRSRSFTGNRSCATAKRHCG